MQCDSGVKCIFVKVFGRLWNFNSSSMGIVVDDLYLVQSFRDAL